MAIAINSPESGLRGARIWLSASLPAANEATGETGAGILEFVAVFAREVFRQGGHIVHGSHPSIVPTLAREARVFIDQGARKDILLLATSQFFSEKDRSFLDVYRDCCVLEESPAARTEDSKEQSLQILRDWMLSRSDAFVAVGGRGWGDGRTQLGVPVELTMAIGRYLPSFIAGGLGGAIRNFLDSNPEVLKSLRNGLCLERNRDIAFGGNVAGVAGEIVEQLTRLPLVRGSGDAGATFRILALDGGGLKGAFAAAVLAKWEEQTRCRIVDHFDLIAGTSTGGILALGLAAGVSPLNMLAFYKEKGPRIFPMTTLGQRVRRQIRRIFSAKFGSGELKIALDNALNGVGPKKTLSDALCRVVVPTFHAVDGVPHVFRTPHQGAVTGDAEVELVQVALATSAAPTYFRAADVASAIANTWYFDGGVWANAPALAAVVEAVSTLGVPLERLDVLSVGTTSEVAFFGSNRKSGMAGWALNLVNLFMNAQEGASLGLTQRLVGTERFFRVNSPAPSGRFKLDDPSKIEELAAKGERIAAAHEVLSVVQRRFLNNAKALPWKKANTVSLNQV